MKTARQHISFLRQLMAPKNYFGLLLSLFLLTLLSTGTADSSLVHTAVVGLGMGLVISIGVAVSKAKHMAYGMICGGFAICMAIVAPNLVFNSSLHLKFFQMSSYVLAIVYIAYAALTIIKDVFSGEVNANRICGAICFYVMVGLCFSMFYFTLDMHDGTSFKVDHFYDGTPKAGLPISVHDRFTLFNYFSFCTLTTVGYGDIAPISQPARTCCWLEAVFGQLYLSILVARLVGLHIAGASGATGREKIQTE